MTELAKAVKPPASGSCLILTLRFPWAVFTGCSPFSHVMDGLGMPLAMHCKVTGLFLTTVFSGRSEDLIVGGTR